jgi:hypothetical protein
MRVVINKCYGGFSVSRKASERLLELKCPHIEKVDEHGYSHECNIEHRTCPMLLQVVEEMGCETASGSLAKLAIVEVPSGIECHIDDYDGIEHVAEDHDTWG